MQASDIWIPCLLPEIIEGKRDIKKDQIKAKEKRTTTAPCLYLPGQYRAQLTAWTAQSRQSSLLASAGNKKHAQMLLSFIISMDILDIFTSQVYHEQWSQGLAMNV